jgi:hypothetical protein
MGRKIIIGVVGATHHKAGNGRPERPVPKEVLELAYRIGFRIGANDAILMTGGEPDSFDRSVKSFAMLGCEAVKDNKNRSLGRMVCVLPNGQRGVRRISGRRRVNLVTGLGSMGRNPITGGTPDLLIVLKGGQGTLVELTFASRQRIATVFAESAECLKAALDKIERDKKLTDSFNADIEKACRRYVLNIGPKELWPQLSELLKTAEDVKSDGQEIAAVAVNAALDRKPQIGRSANFEGIPDDKGNRCLKQEFDKAIEDLSALGPGATF